MSLNSVILNTPIGWAFKEYGISEIAGDEHNPEVVKYFKEIGFANLIDDETAWCSAFVNWCCMKAGVERTGKLNARSWLDKGAKVDVPLLGDVIVFWRHAQNSKWGHVAFYINHDANYYYVLGGNQNNMVKVSAYPVNQFLGARRMRTI